MVAVVSVSELHIAVVVRSCVLPSVYVPVAINASVVPSAIVAFSGVTAIDTSAAAVTVSVVVPCTPPEVAVIVAVPAATLRANPCFPAVLLMVAVPVASEVQCTVVVTSCTLLSVNVPVAMNCWLVPSAMAGIAGVTAIDTSTAGLTVRVVVPVIEPDVAVALVLPTLALAATPCALTLVIDTSAVLHDTVFVMSSVLPSV